MATFAAIKLLGKSIASDIRDAKDTVAAGIKRAQVERRVMADFKAALRAHPVELTKALTAISEPAPKAKRARKVAQ